MKEAIGQNPFPTRFTCNRVYVRKTLIYKHTRRGCQINDLQRDVWPIMLGQMPFPSSLDHSSSCFSFLILYLLYAHESLYSPLFRDTSASALHTQICTYNEKCKCRMKARGSYVTAGSMAEWGLERSSKEKKQSNFCLKMPL